MMDEESPLSFQFVDCTTLSVKEEIIEDVQNCWDERSNTSETDDALTQSYYDEDSQYILGDVGSPRQGSKDIHCSVSRLCHSDGDPKLAPSQRSNGKVCSCPACVKRFVMNMHFAPSELRHILGGPKLSSQSVSEPPSISEPNDARTAYPCEYCEKVFPTKNDCTSHKICVHTRQKTVLHRRPLQIDCELIQTDLATKPEEEMLKSKNKRRAKFTSSEKQLKVKSDSKNCYLCEKCNMSFSKISQFKKHLKTHPVLRITGLTCKVCNKTFKGKGHLKRHYRVKHDIYKTNYLMKGVKN